MTRQYANVQTSIWRRESDFRNLTSSEQRTYFMLKTQSDISAAGVLPLTIGRWASLASDTTPETIRMDLKGLEAAQYVIVDESTEELLVRTFVKWDKGYNNPKRTPVIWQAAREIISPLLLQALKIEFERVGLLKPAPAAAALEIQPAETFPQANRLSGSHPHTQDDGHPRSQDGGLSPSDRVVVTKALEVSTPTLNPHPPTHAAELTPIPIEEGEGDDPELLAAFIREIRAARPEWTTRSIAQALSDGEVAERPWRIVVAAMRIVAADPKSSAPGRLRGDGPWWSQAAATAAKREPSLLPPKCDECDHNRLVLLSDGRATRCPNCHPRRDIS